MTELDDAMRECDRLRTQLEVERGKALHFHDRWVEAGNERDRLSEEVSALQLRITAEEAANGVLESERDSALSEAEDWDHARDELSDQVDALEAELHRLRLGLGSDDDLPGTGPLIAEPADRTAHYQRIERFHDGMGRHDPRRPTVPDRETRVARARMLFEECLEAVHALGARVSVVGNDYGAIELGNQLDPDKGDIVDAPDPGLWWVRADLMDPDDIDLAHAVKELADISVVTTGTMVCMGALDRAVLEEVDRNNASKLHGGKARFRSDGKLLKGPEYRPVDLTGILERQPRR